MWKAYVPDYIPQYSRACGKVVDARVSSVQAYPPGKHPKGCPVVHSLTAVKICTTVCSGWYGFDKAYIDGSLRMVVERAENRDEMLAKWESADRPFGVDYGTQCYCPRCGISVGERHDFCARCEEYLSQDDPGALYPD